MGALGQMRHPQHPPQGHRGNHGAALRTLKAGQQEALDKEGTWPTSAGKGRELQVEEGAEAAEAEAPIPRTGPQV